MEFAVMITICCCAIVGFLVEATCYDRHKNEFETKQKDANERLKTNIESNRKKSRQILSLQSKCQKLKKDNIKLQEKIHKIIN